jgi:hypothetical protein
MREHAAHAPTSIDAGAAWCGAVTLTIVRRRNVTVMTLAAGRLLESRRRVSPRRKTKPRLAVD